MSTVSNGGLAMRAHVLYIEIQLRPKSIHVGGMEKLVCVLTT